MKHPADIQKIEREDRQSRCQEIHKIAFPIKFKRKMKPRQLAKRQKDPSLSRKSRLEEGMDEASSKELIIVLKDLPASRESWPIDREDEASSSSSVVESMVMTETEALLKTTLQSQELAIAARPNLVAIYTSIGHILEI